MRAAIATMNLWAVLAALGLAGSGFWYVGSATTEKRMVLFGIALLLGITLYHASFGFTSAWRRFIVERDGKGLRAQMLMLAIAVALFFPALAIGEVFGQRVGGFVAPAGTSVLVGAFIFGIGMQMGGGCASGTLFTVGGGSTRMLITLLFFVIGSVIATAHMDFWLDLPRFRPYSVVKNWGLWPALAGNLALFGSIAWLAWYFDKDRRAEADTLKAVRTDRGVGEWIRVALQGPWPIIWGAVLLAVLNFATLAIAGRPWGITSGFALWGAKLFDTVGIGVTEWPYWSGGRLRSVERDLVYNLTSVMNVGIMIGAFLAAGLAGKFAPTWRLSRTDVLTAVIGGLMLGYGARLAFGCNIGAFFSGIASGSLHGWLWLIAGFAGNIIGTKLRPFVGLSRV